MTCDYRCPFCGCEIEDPDWWENGDEYEKTCPECGNSFSVGVEIEPSFQVLMPKELEACEDCGVWNFIYEFCDYEKHGFHDMERCPLGHPANRGEEGK